MNGKLSLDEAAHYAANHRGIMSPMSLWRWKRKIIFASMRQQIQIDNDTVDRDELEAWLKELKPRQEWGKREPTTIRFEKDLLRELRGRFGGKHGLMSDFVNSAVREKITKETKELNHA